MPCTRRGSRGLGALRWCGGGYVQGGQVGAVLVALVELVGGVWWCVIGGLLCVVWYTVGNEESPH